MNVDGKAEEKLATDGHEWGFGVVFELCLGIEIHRLRCVSSEAKIRVHSWLIKNGLKPCHPICVHLRLILFSSFVRAGE